MNGRSCLFCVPHVLIIQLVCRAFPLWCLVWVVHPSPMSPRAAAARRAAPSLPLTCPPCLQTLIPPCLFLAMSLTSPSRTTPLPSRPRPLEHLHPHHPQQPRPPTPTGEKSGVCGASTGSPSQRRRSAGSQTSGRLRSGSSSSRSTSALWRSCLGSRRRWPPIYVEQHLERHRVCPGPALLRRAARGRWVEENMNPHVL